MSEDTVNNINSSPCKCQYFDKEFCYLKAQFVRNHPSTDCDGKYVDQNICPFRHRKHWKNQNNCMFDASETCEFLYHGGTPVNQSTEAIQMSLANLTPVYRSSNLVGTLRLIESIGLRV